MKKSILFSDTTLRDGNHACGHSLSLKNYDDYSRVAEKVGLDFLEVGHGNGIGASSLQVGILKCKDKDILKVCRQNLKKTKLSIHSIPGFSSIEKDLKLALDCGVDLVRVASHCTEYDTQTSQIKFLKSKKVKVLSTLMMCHMINDKELAIAADYLRKIGIDGIVLMDSAGCLIPEDVIKKISILKKKKIKNIGFHAHNNLGFAVINSIVASKSGANIIDGTALGFGAGAGNAQLETLVYAFKKYNINHNINFNSLEKLIKTAEKFAFNPIIDFDGLLSGYYGIFSGFKKHIQSVSNKYNLNKADLYKQLSKHKPVAGQEDSIILAANELIRKNEKNKKDY